MYIALEHQNYGKFLMKMAIKHENDEFLVITLKHVSGLTVIVNCPRSPKEWAIVHENSHKTKNDEFLVISLKHVLGLTGHAIPPRTPKLWAIAHESDHKT